MIIPVTHKMNPMSNILFRIIGKIKSKLFNKLTSNWKNYPVIINNFNRLEFLQQQIAWLEKSGSKNIYIIDNNSTYPPLLAFYKSTKHTVFKLNKNIGHLALWKTHVFKWFENSYYVYTDPDIVPIEKCPPNAIYHFKTILDKYPEIGKVGFGLKIDDIPEYYPLKEKVINWEKRFWTDSIEKEVYKAKIDTTFALYRPNTKGDWQLPALRTGGKYIARHLPWYVDYNNLSKEEQYLIQTASNVSSWNQELKKTNSRY